MPLYQFLIPADSPSAALKAELADAVTDVHTDVTGAPAAYVNVSFTELEPDSLFVSGRPVAHGRLVGIIRAGRSPETKRELMERLAHAWAKVTGEPPDGFALFIQEVPGSSMLEEGRFLPEAADD
ncbi:hypothetical protein BH20ACT6_BH20ACT6_14760 [soil metagenome]